MSIEDSPPTEAKASNERSRYADIVDEAIETARRNSRLEPFSPYFDPKKLGATAILDCTIWSADWRERLSPEDRERFTGEGTEPIKEHGTQESLDGFEILHEAALKNSRLVR